MSDDVRRPAADGSWEVDCAREAVDGIAEGVDGVCEGADSVRDGVDGIPDGVDDVREGADSVLRVIDSVWDHICTVRDTIDAILLGLFGRHADGSRHGRDRTRFRSLHPEVTFETFVSRLYGLSWLVFVLVASAGYGLTTVVLSGGLVVPPLPIGPGSSVVIQPAAIGILTGGVLGGLAKLGTRVAASGVLALLVRRRRTAVEHTLPGAVRYLHVISAGTADPAELFEGVVAQRRIHGATADSFEAVLRVARIAGSVETGIRTVARDTASKDDLAPFLWTFLARSREGPDALREFLHFESRLLATEDERAHRRESRYLTAVVQLFVLLLVVPVVLVIAAVGATVALPAFTPALKLTQVPELSTKLAVAGSGVILLLGGGAAFLALLLRPSGHRWAAPAPSKRPIDVIRTGARNPTNALVIGTPLALGVVVAWLLGGHPATESLVLGYVVLAIPVGLVDARRARLRAAMDRHLPGFVHAVAERVDAGVPFRTAIRRVARETDLGPLDPPVARLAVDLSVGGHDGPVRKRALERFIGRIGTPLAGRTIGLAVGALDAGADMRSALTALQTETGRLVHADRARRSRFPVVIVVGWTVALLIVAIVVIVNLMVLDGATAAGTGPVQGVVVDTTIRARGHERPLFYLLTQSSMLASGWFAGVAGRGVYEGLLHSGGLVAVTFVVFRVAGLV